MLAVLEALAGKGGSDSNGDGWLSVTELEGCLVRRVRTLTDNQQKSDGHRFKPACVRDTAVYGRQLNKSHGSSARSLVNWHRLLPRWYLGAG